jgi:hypothetical protein
LVAEPLELLGERLLPALFFPETGPELFGSAKSVSDDGQRYLVAPRGDTQWVRNLRATGRGELRGRGGVEPFRATEIPDNEKPRVIEAYFARWGYQVKGYFKALPDPADHPVFRVERLADGDSNRS